MTRNHRQHNITTLLALLLAWWVPSAAMGAPATTTASPATAPSDRTLRFDEHNFTFEAPSIPWMVQPPERLPPQGVVGYIRAWPFTAFTIISEPVGVEGALTPQDMETAALAHVR